MSELEGADFGKEGLSEREREIELAKERTQKARQEALELINKPDARREEIIAGIGHFQDCLREQEDLIDDPDRGLKVCMEDTQFYLDAGPSFRENALEASRDGEELAYQEGKDEWMRQFRTIIDSLESRES